MQLQNIFEQVRTASRSLNMMEQTKIDAVLLSVALAVEERCDYIIEQNKLDLDRMSTDNPMYDRLLLNRERVEGMVADLRNVASLQSPVGEVLSDIVRPNGMKITKIRVPFGVIGVVFEARPNVSLDVFALCFKSSNACILKGGKDAQFSNEAIVSVIRSVLGAEGIDPSIATLLPADREATAELLNAVGYVDLLIPRGSSSLINYVRDTARVPVIETGAGICHVYFDSDGDLDKGAAIVLNSKTRRVSVCNALDCLIINSSRLSNLAELCKPLISRHVVIYADERAHDALVGLYPADLLLRADESSFGTEFLDYKMSIKTVDSLAEATEHISRFSSKHSEAIVTENRETAARYAKIVDAACVYTNVATSFTDGAQFGLGAEIGISTQKLHARGPMALAELTSYKYLISGDGQVRQ